MEKKQIMKNLTLTIMGVLILAALAAQAQTRPSNQGQTPAADPAAAPQPGPEHKKLAVWLGDWTYDGENKATQFGPATKVTGKVSVQSILGGFFVEFRGEETDASGNVDRWIEIDGYDPVKKCFTWTTFGADGGTQAITYSLDGSNMKYEGTIQKKGKQVKIRGTLQFGADFMSWVEKGEFSADGKKWTPGYESKGTKAKSP